MRSVKREEMGVKAQSRIKKSTCLSASNRLVIYLFRLDIQLFRESLLFTILTSCPGKLFLLFLSIFAHLILRKGHAAV